MGFTKEQKYIHLLALHCADVPSATGLLRGEMGIVLVLAHYAKARNNPYIEKVADFVLEQVLDNLTKHEDIGLAYGLSGIGWGLEYLIQNGYLKGDSIDICEEIDKRIMSVDIRRMCDKSFETGMRGILMYVLLHLQGGLKNGQFAFDAGYLNDWTSRLRMLIEEEPREECWQEGLRIIESMAKTQGFSQQPLTLRPFIKTMTRCPPKKLGLQDGLAGYIELQLTKEESV